MIGSEVDDNRTGVSGFGFGVSVSVGMHASGGRSYSRMI